MKKVLFLMIGAFLMVGSINAQDYSKLLKKSSKALGKYKQNPSKNATKLDEALNLLDDAFAIEGAATSTKAWSTKAKIYNEIADSQIKRKLIDGEAYAIANPESAITAFKALQKAFELAEKKGDKKELLKGMRESERHLDNMAIFLYNNKDYTRSFDNFAATLDASQLLKDNGKESIITDEAALNDKTYSTAVTGYYSQNGDRKAASQKYFKKLYEMGTNEPLVYEALYTINAESDPAASEKYLNEGREKFPTDKTILFAVINSKLAKEDLEGAQATLKEAIVADPENVSVYVTTGSVYERLGAQEMEKGDQVKSDEYFDLALDYYIQGLAKDAENFEASYSIGALHYNKAAGMTADINKYANDFSKAGTQKYNDAKANMNALFNKALPLFQKAESLNPSDMNTLVALKEIYARLNNMDKSTEYKNKIEKAR